MAINYSTDLGKVRNLINDVESPPVLADERITAFLDTVGGDAGSQARIYGAAALALYAIASSRHLVDKARKVRLYVLSVDYSEAASELRRLALDLLNQAGRAPYTSIDPMVIGEEFATDLQLERDAYENAVASIFEEQTP